MSRSVEGALQEASLPLPHAVEILRHRPADHAAAKALVPELHELRSLMSTVTLLMSSFDLPRFAEVVRPSQGVRPVRVLQEADAELSAVARTAIRRPSSWIRLAVRLRIHGPRRRTHLQAEVNALLAAPPRPPHVAEPETCGGGSPAQRVAVKHGVLRRA